MPSPQSNKESSLILYEHTRTDQKLYSAVQPTTVKSEYASVGDLEMYYEIHGAKIVKEIIASEFMTIDGVIQNEEADGDGF